MSMRPAVEDDAYAIARVQILAWRQAYAGMMPQAFLDRMDSVRRVTGWRRALSAPGAMATDVVLGQAGEIIGFFVYGPSRDADAAVGTGELVAINLLPAHWRQGLGRVMMTRLLTVAAERRWQAVTLWVLEANMQARRFYEAHGFEADGASQVDANLTGTPLHLVRYRRLLPLLPAEETA
ncbi:GNAT family N-acetyltransferase|uniref:GNAT family N-acetyltransferase n=1 Tax=Noviherbaspirillum sp. L7-7A TaxID=2850560 RepID=UPI001C2C6E88|nr:GNAT family N-acetyltransferase [Noviherbaspirillum sp. L7-7A]MBV0880580.1 GNAT family N-acetyltransferase [Noviherbaspirillum sp. L7-7A]